VASRRTLAEGLKAKPKADRRKEEAFVFGEADKAGEEKPKPPKRKPEAKEKPKAKREGEEATPATPPAMPSVASRMPLTTRIRSDLASALKRASLERQLAGEKPNTVQDILEQALEPWLKEHGYLKD
jgi:hypothetical protein